MKVLKKYWYFVALVVAGTSLFAASNDFTDFWTLKGRGTLINTAIAWVDEARDMILYDGDMVLGGKGSQPSTTAGEYPGLKVQIKNCGTDAWVQGTLVVSTSAAAGCGATSSAVVNQTGWIGISEGAVAAGAIGYITVGGYALALATGTVSRGDVVVSTTVAGYVASDTTPTTGADVGVSLSSNTALTGGLIIIRLR